METSIYVVIILSSILFFFFIVLAVVFLSFSLRSKSRHELRGGHGSTAGSSTRSRMAARFAHMEHASLKDQAFKPPHQDDVEEVIRTYPVQDDEDCRFPDEFGIGGGIATSRGSRRSLPSSAGGDSALVGTGPNGTRTFLKGWFGLDEPNFSGFNVGPEVREKNDALPMRTPGPGGSDLDVPHHRVPTTEDTDWETASAHEDMSISQAR